MTTQRVVTLAALVVLFAGATYAATAARTVAPFGGMLGGLQGMHEDSTPGPDSARIAGMLDALGRTDRLVCDMFADQLGNFWGDGNSDGFGAFADAGLGAQAAKDSLHGRVREPRAINLLIARLETENPCVRRAAAKLLGRSRVTTERLVRLLDDATPRVREAAAFSLGVNERPTSRVALESKLDARDGALAAMSAWALAELHDSASVPAFVRALRNSNALVRVGVVRGLGEIRDEATVGDVERALRDDHPGVRHQAAHSLGEFGLERSAPVLAAALSDADAEVRYAAAGALGQLHELRKAPAALVRAASSADSKLAELAVHALAEIHDPETIDVMIGLLTNTNREIRLRVVEALGNMGSPKAIPGLVRALKDPDAEVRRAAAEALGELREG